MTVRELINALLEMPLDMEVSTEGCDCYGDVAKVAVDDEIDKVMLYRTPWDIPAIDRDKKAFIEKRRKARVEREVFAEACKNFDDKGNFIGEE